MDWLTFISELAKASLWPVAAIVAMLSFRKELKALVRQMKKGKVGAAEFEFEKALLELPPANVQTPAPNHDAVVQPLTFPHSDTRRLIRDTWTELEDSVRDLLRSRNLPESVLPRRASGLARALTELKLLDPDQIDLFQDLRNLSIREASDPNLEPSIEAAVNFIQATDQLRMAVVERTTNPSQVASIDQSAA